MTGRLTAVVPLILWALLPLAWEGPLQAQEEDLELTESDRDRQLDSESRRREITLATAAEAAQFQYHAGMRDLDRAADLAAKAERAEKPAKVEKIRQNVDAAYLSATEKFHEALRLDPTMIEAYEFLGLAYRRLGDHAASLEVHATALREAPDSMANFRGWTESLLALDLLDDATVAYDGYARTDPERAAVLMEGLREWLDARQTDPGSLDPADIERLAAWIEQQEGG